MRTVVFGLMLACTGCASPQYVANTQAYEAALASSRAQPLDETYRRYQLAFNDVVNGKNLYTKNGCDGRGPGSIHLILKVEKDGSVSDVIAQEETEKARCYRETFRSIRFPSPPYTPLYLEYLMKPPY